jgi:hypothetical protein
MTVKGYIYVAYGTAVDLKMLVTCTVNENEGAIDKDDEMMLKAVLLPCIVRSQF